MKPRWQDLPNKQNMSVDELSGVVGPALNDIKKMLSGKLSIEDNQLAAIVSRQTTHLTTFRIKNPLPFGTRVRGVRALRSILSNGTSGLPVDSIEWDYAGDDIVMSVKFAPPQGFVHVKRSANQTIATSTHTQVSFDENLFGPSGNISHSTTTNPTRITCAVSGIVSVSGYVKFGTSATGYKESFVCKNGVTDAYNARYGHSSNAMLNAGAGADSFGDEVDVVAGDYIQLDVYQTSGGNLTLHGDLTSGQTRMTVRYVAPPTDYSALVEYVIEGG